MRCLATLVLAVLLSGCARPGASYFPSTRGLWWEYGLAVTILDETSRQKQLVRNVGSGTLDAQQVLVQEQPGGYISFFRQTNAGIERVATRSPGASEPVPDGPQHFVLRTPIAVGTSWHLESRLTLIESRTFEPRDRIIPRRYRVVLDYRIESLDDRVTVPAGRFEQCLRVRATGRAQVRVDRGNAIAEVLVEHLEWYAPGVGLVRSMRRESADSTFLKPGEYLMELERSGS